jgi:GNAT superfamily N-acetyltransferase
VAGAVQGAWDERDGQEHDPEIVERIEAAEVDSFVRLYQFAEACCGTGWYEVDGIEVVWSRRDDDPGYSCVINLDAAEDPAGVLAKIERAAREAGAIVLGIDGSPAVIERISEEQLRGLGFVQHYQECMWGRHIRADETFATETPPGLRVERASDADRELFAGVLNVGYDLPEDVMRGHIFASAIGQPGWYHYLVYIDDQPASASVLYVTGGVANLIVATTKPEFRGRGAQTALIRRRLADAQAAGCDLATSQTVVDNASPRNMARHGFFPLYYRWIWGKSLTT